MLACACAHSAPSPRTCSFDTRPCSSRIPPAKPKDYNVRVNLLLQLHVQAGQMPRARQLFDRIPQPSLVSWTILMSGYARHGPAHEALTIFGQMVDCYSDSSTHSCSSGKTSEESSGGNAALSLWYDSFVFAVVLRACTDTGDIGLGREIHCQALKVPLEVDSFVENALLNMYASCGALEDSYRVFRQIGRPDLVSWSTLMSGFVQNGYDGQAVVIFSKLCKAGILPDGFVLSIVIAALANLQDYHTGTHIHGLALKIGLCSGLFLANTLMDLYAECGDVEAARRVFDELSEKNLVSWNTMITCYVHNFQYREALKIFQGLMLEVCHCDEFTLSAVLQALATLGDVNLGKQVHGYVIRNGLELNTYVNSALLEMYIKCEEHQRSDRCTYMPFKIFRHINNFDVFALASLLKLCAVKSDLETGRMLHSCIVKIKLESDPYVSSSLIDMYRKCGILEAALRVFMRIRDPGTVAWSSIIAGYSGFGKYDQALRLFQIMQFNQIEANEFTYTSAVLACTALGHLKKGRELHCNMMRTGYGSYPSVVNSLLNLYCELGHLEQALRLRSFISDSEISWNVIVQACRKISDPMLLLNLLSRIQQSNGQLDHISVCHVLLSCANPLLLNAGTQVQAYITKRGLLFDTHVSNSLINMYSESGDIGAAVQAFDKLPEKNSDSWASIVAAYVDYGESCRALEMFNQMCRRNKLPDSRTFASVLKACAQTGLVNEAFQYFHLMQKAYGIELSPEHYAGIVEVLSRAGMFDEAEQFIGEVIPFEPRPLMWKTLLSSSRIYGNMRVAKYAAEKLLELEPWDFNAKQLLEQILMTVGNWDHSLRLRSRLTRTGCSSFIELRSKIYVFDAGQILNGELQAKIVEMKRKMEELGYVGDKTHWLHDAEEGYHGVSFYYHSEMKALAFGLAWLPAGEIIRIVKCERMCGHCHSACKFMSTLIGRDLIIKDSCRFHCFRNGKCSCKDKW